MYATAEFSFNQADNGWLMSEFAFMRSIFLLFMFPPIISWGRGWVTRKSGRSSPPPLRDGIAEAQPGHIPTDPGEFDATVGEQVDEEPLQVSRVDNDREASKFDLIFLRWSLVVDGALTTIAAFATQRWHIYLGIYPGPGHTDRRHFMLTVLAAFLLPFGSGSAPAAKGVITEMCTDSQRADALNAVTLVENIARLATQGLFGFVFAAFAGIGRAYLTFFCNAVS
jgi:hypothetical protein